MILKLVRRRDELMAEAVSGEQGGMAAIIGLEIGKIRAIIAGTGVETANLNSPDQTVISGYKNILEKLEGSFLKEGARRVVFLNVSAPFHCRLMEKTVRGLAGEVKKITLKRPKGPFWVNVTGEEVSYPEEIKALLVQQVTDAVLWEKWIIKMVEADFEEFFLFGPGKTLRILMRSINQKIKTKEVSNSRDLKSLI